MSNYCFLRSHRPKSQKPTTIRQRKAKGTSRKVVWVPAVVLAQGPSAGSEVGGQVSCSDPQPRHDSSNKKRDIGAMSGAEFTVSTDGCRTQTMEVNYLEHVQVIGNHQAQRHDGVELYLMSPAGTKSTLLGRHMLNTSGNGLSMGAFMATHCSGETAVGLWKLEVKNSGTMNESGVCQLGQFPLNNSCLHECPPGSFRVDQTKNRTVEEMVTMVPSCIVCHATCIRCSGKEPSDCLQCVAGRNLTSKGTCVTTAPHHKAWSSAMQISILVIITCLFVLPIVVCTAINLPIKVSFDKPLLNVSSPNRRWRTVMRKALIVADDEVDVGSCCRRGSRLAVR